MTTGHPVQYRWWRLDGPVTELHAAVDALRRDTVPERVAQASWQRQAQQRAGAFRLLVCGSPYWTDRALLAQVVERVVAEQAAGRPVLLIEGDARGADRLAGELAQARGWQVEAYPAPWQRYGRAAGPIRNAHMLRLGRPELVLAFTDDLTSSRGTADLVRGARAAGLPVQVIGHDRPRWLLRVELPWACFGLVVDDHGRVTVAAPIARWAEGRRGQEVAAAYRRRGGQVTWHQLPTPGEVTPRGDHSRCAAAPLP
jgi:hypothetical protein